MTMPVCRSCGEVVHITHSTQDFPGDVAHIILDSPRESIAVAAGRFSESCRFGDWCFNFTFTRGKNRLYTASGATVVSMPGPNTHHPAEPNEGLKAVEAVVIDLQHDADRWRYTCPNNHRNWDRTNNHLWCQTCRRQYEAGHEEMDPEHYHVRDQKSGALIPWSRVRIVGDGNWASHAVGD